MNLQSRVWFFTSESTMKKNRFMQKLNHSYREGGLTCGFNDYQLAEYIQQKRRKRWWKLGPWKMGHGYWDPTSTSTPMGKQYNTTEWIWLQRWCAAQLSISLEILPPLEHLLCLTHLTMYPASELTCRLSDLLHSIYPAKQQNHWWFIDWYPCFHTSWCCP